MKKSENHGVSVERKEAVQPFYVISKMGVNGVAAKSKQFRIVDEIVETCGRRLCGMLIVEARHTLKTCSGTIELQIFEEPTSAFGVELGDTWCDILVRTRNDFEMTMLKQRSTAIVHDSINVVQQETPSQYKIMGTLMKNGKNLFGSFKERLKRKNEGTIRKFI